MFNAPFVEPLQRIPSQYVTIKAPLSRWAVVALLIVRCGIFIAPGRASPVGFRGSCIDKKNLVSSPKSLVQVPGIDFVLDLGFVAP
jgi:hypothetical protein